MKKEKFLFDELDEIITKKIETITKNKSSRATRIFFEEMINFFKREIVALEIAIELGGKINGKN